MSERTTFGSRLPQGPKNLFMAGMAEFVGTFMFLFLVLGAVSAVNTAGPQEKTFILASNPSQLLYICISFGISLAVTVACFFRVSGGQFNPAVTLALVLVGAVGPVRGVVIFLAQLLAGMAAAGVLQAILPGPLQATTTLRSDTNLAQGVFIEMFCTSILALTVLMVAVEKHKATPMAPWFIGMSLFIAELTSIPYTGGSINPARSFGPCVATRSFPTEHWIYWVGPLLGGALATLWYKIIKTLEYETVNPGQDDIGEPAHAFDEQKHQHQHQGALYPDQHQHPSGTDLGGQRKLSGDTRVGEGFRNGPVLESQH